MSQTIELMTQVINNIVAARELAKDEHLTWRTALDLHHLSRRAAAELEGLRSVLEIK